MSTEANNDVKSEQAIKQERHEIPSFTVPPIATHRCPPGIGCNLGHPCRKYLLQTVSLPIRHVTDYIIETRPQNPRKVFAECLLQICAERDKAKDSNEKNYAEPQAFPIEATYIDKDDRKADLIESNDTKKNELNDIIESKPSTDLNTGKKRPHDETDGDDNKSKEQKKDLKENSREERWMRRNFY